MEIKDLLAQTSKLPNVPEVVRELIQALNQPNADYSEIAQKVSKDQTLSLKILRLVNSAHFGLSRKVSSIDEATVMLGMEKLKTLVIASGFANSTGDVEGLDIKSFWSESFRVATLAKWLAEQTDKVEADKAFTAGVIHNIGRLLLHLAQPNRAQAIQTLIEESGVSRSEAERERLGFATQDAGKELLDMWKFPEELGIAVQQHKKPLTFQETQALSCVINIACYLNAAIRDQKDEEAVIEGFPTEVAINAGLPADIVDKLPEALTIESGLDSLAA
ncbi:HDOD domain-containing protein [Neptunomonas sp. XY-337]|uniref:HDOD domain-containing protein n=1 Tax=Neptunomonas sp. XY-337 TaxID=2561897 RepID=UPI0010AA1DFE|nr:HDOD domain-containing protein [Neptunomonas sp. XY-337]